MGVVALDHINICTMDVPATAAFFADVLGMTVTASGTIDDLAQSAWLLDDAGRAIVHLSSEALMRRFMPVAGGNGGGCIHHVALRCTDHDGVVARLAERGIPARHSAGAGRRVIIVPEHNGILLELNFPDA